MTPDLKPSWFTDKLEAPDRLGQRSRGRSPFGDMLNIKAPQPSQAQVQKMSDDEMAGLEALVPGLGG